MPILTVETSKLEILKPSQAKGSHGGLNGSHRCVWQLDEAAHVRNDVAVTRVTAGRGSCLGG